MTTGVAECQTWECSFRIVYAVSVLYEEQWRVCTFLECLCPDCVIVVTVIVCTGKRDVEEGTTCELCIEIDTVPCEVKVETVSELRTVRTSDTCLVTYLVDQTVTIEVDILDVTDVRSVAVPCRVVDFLFCTEETVCNPYIECIERCTYNLTDRIYVRLVRIDDPTVLGVSEGSADAVLEWLAAEHEVVLV